MEDVATPLHGVAFLLFVLLLNVPALGAERSVSVEDVDRLLDAGAMTLASDVLQSQPEFVSDPGAWEQWERRRLQIHVERRDWSALLARLAEHPAALPNDFTRWAVEQGARSSLALGDGEAAREALARLIWDTATHGGAGPPDAEQLARWRDLLAQSYLVVGNLPAARNTMLRYRLDYGEDAPGWRLALAKVLIQSGDDDQARDLLEGLPDPEAEFLRLLVAAREPGADSEQLLVRMGPSLDDPALDAGLRAQLWAALAGVAARYRDHETRVVAMEQALALRAPRPPGDDFVTVDGDGLWDAYLAYATVLANEAHLLVGRFDAWLALADELSRRDPLKARALYAYLSLRQRDAKTATAAQVSLMAMLAREDHGLRIIGGLYLGSQRYPQASSLPKAARGPLLALLMNEPGNDIGDQLAAGIDAQARGALPAAWRSPVALALIGRNRPAEGAALMIAGIRAGGEDRAFISPEDVVEVALALQAAAATPAARELLEGALAAHPGDRERRELLFTLAEINSSDARHRDAAHQFLASAAQGEGVVADAWSLAATVRAVRSLRAAGLDEDANRVLETALAGNPTPEARAFLEHAERY